jgi:ribonuclease D
MKSRADGLSVDSLNVRFPHIEGGPILTNHRLAIVRALYNWREETAAHSNRPTRAIVRDDLIIEFARRNPTRERDLQVVRGLPRRDLDAIIQTVAEARSLPLEACPIVSGREQDPLQLTLVSSVLTAVLGDVCLRRGLVPNLVAGNNDVKLLVRARLAEQPPPTEPLLGVGWRRTHILPDLLAVLDGRRSVRIADITADAPFDYAEIPNTI